VRSGLTLELDAFGLGRPWLRMGCAAGSSRLVATSVGVYGSPPLGQRDFESERRLGNGYRGSVPHARGRRQVRFHRWRVLVVEDDDSFAEALRELLEVDGRLALAGRARDGRERVELAEALRPDVVLMDVGLRVMDGVEATREIGRRQPTIPVVGITGSDYEERALEIRDAGAVDFVGKDRLDPDLVEIVVAAAHRRRRRRRGRLPSG
jgi:CheY-like chemotaxis protein